MNFRTDSETVGAALEAIAPVFYGTFDEVQNEGVTEAEAFYIAVSDVSIEYNNDTVTTVDVSEKFSIGVYVRTVQQDAEIRALELVSLALSALVRVEIGTSPVLVTSATRAQLETQWTCLYNIEAETQRTETI